MAEISFSNGRPGLATVNPHGLKAAPPPGRAGQVEKVEGAAVERQADLGEPHAEEGGRELVQLATSGEGAAAP